MEHSDTSRAESPAVRFFVRLGLGVVALALSIGAAIALVRTKPKPATEPTAAHSIVVDAITASERPVGRSWNGYGTVRAQSVADVAAEVAGVIIARPDTVEAGRRVDAGAEIIRIDARDYQEQLEAAQHVVTALESQLESVDVETDSLQESVGLAEEGISLFNRELARAHDAQTRGAATENEVEALRRSLTTQQRELTELRQRYRQAPIRRAELEAQIRQQRTLVRQAELNVERTVVRAPIAGILQTIHVNIGDWIGTGQPVARIVNLSRIEAPIRMPISASSALRLGDTLALRTDGPDQRRWEAKIVRLAPEADSQTRTITVYAEVAQDGREIQDDTLLPGQFVAAEAQSSRLEPHVIIPRNAVLGDRVAVIGADGRVRWRPVEVAFAFDASFSDINRSATQWVALSRGVEAGERVAISNIGELDEGMAVQAENDAVTPTPTARREATTESAGRKPQ